MADIHQIGTADVVTQLPQLIPWNRSCTGEAPIPLLVTCAGFEERALAIVKAIGSTPILRHIIVEYPTNQSDNAESLRALQAISANETRALKYQRTRFLKDISDALDAATVPDAGEVLVDVSGMSSYVMSRVVGSIFNRLPQCRLHVFYAEADEYHPIREAWDRFYEGVADPSDNLSIATKYEEMYFQARGAEETYECDMFPGINPGPLGTMLVVVPSFSLQRVKSMTSFAESRYNVSPQSTRWFLGAPPDKSRNGWRADAVAALYNVKDHGMAVDTLDYRDVLRKLDDVWSHCVETEKHMMIAAMGSKMQNFGLLLFLFMHEESGLLHCEPSEFIADRYSVGVGPIWSLDLGIVSSLRRTLQSRGALRFNWGS